MSKVIEEIGPSKVVAVVTDNAQNMKAAWRRVSTKYPHISCYGCVTHALNLIYADIFKIPTVTYINSSVTNVIKYIKNKHIVLAYFENTQNNLYGQMKQTLKLPSKTRWNGMVISLESYLSNKELLKALAMPCLKLSFPT